MLINYTFKNFRSFKNQTSLTMNAGVQRTFNDTLLLHGNKRILPSAVIYGANASGKSNIIMSLSVMRDIILQGSIETLSPDLNNLELYPFAHSGDQSPMLFEIEFTNTGSHFIYNFEIMVSRFHKGDRKITSEKLSILDGKNSLQIFERTADHVVFNREKRALSVIQYTNNLLQEFEVKINKNLGTTDLLLPGAFKTVINNEIAEKVIDFFKNKLLVVSDFTLKKTSLTFTSQEKSEKNFMLWNDTLDGFVKNADFGPQSIKYKSNKSEDEHSPNMQLVSIYKSGDQNIIIPAELMESRGTLKLLDFALPFESLFSKGGVFVIDEFDAAIHPELVKGIISLFNDPSVNINGAQLIFTTHNPIYLNNQIFRRDQIKFVEKDKDTYESIIYSLADFGSTDVRNDQNYLINYFKGKYGTLPYIDFAKVFTSQEEEK